MGRRTNLALAVLLVTAVVSGLASQAIGVDWPLDTAVIHGAVALAILLLSPWKTSIVRPFSKLKLTASTTSIARVAAPHVEAALRRSALVSATAAAS